MVRDQQAWPSAMADAQHGCGPRFTFAPPSPRRVQDCERSTSSLRKERMQSQSTSSRVQDRVSAIQAHLEPSAPRRSNGDSSTTTSQPSSRTTPAAMASRPPITCHILDTTSGKPAPGVRVVLQLLSETTSTNSFEAITNADGRVAAWEAASGSTSIQEVFQSAPSSARWALTFYTGDYYESKNIDPFFPEVTIKIVTKSKEEHYHVPLLLGPYNYTTYRGS